MKKLSSSGLLLLLLSQCLPLAAQTEQPFRNRSYVNALLIAEYSTHRQFGLDSTLSRVYAPDSQLITNPAIPKVKIHHLALFKDNPFNPAINPVLLQMEIANLRKHDSEKKLALQSGQAGAQGAGSLFGALAPSSAYQSLVIDAVAKLVAEEFQASVSTVFLNRFRERLEEPDLEGLRKLLPQTHDLLKRGNFFRFNAIGQEFRATFEEDLKELPTHLNDYLEANQNLKPPFSTLRSNPGLYRPFHFSTDAADKLLHGYTPAQLLDYLSATYSPNADYQEYYQAVELINLIQKNLQDETKLANAQIQSSIPGMKRQFENIWLDFNQLRRLFNDPADPTKQKMKFFFGLIYQDNLDFFKTLIPVVADRPTQVNLTDPGTVFGRIARQVNPALTVLLKMNALLEKEKLSADDYNQLMQHCLALLETVNTVPKTAPFNPDALQIFRKVIDIHKSILRRDYAQVVPNVVFLFDKLPKVQTRDGADATAWIRVRNVLTRYGPFVTGVVSAQNSEELKNVLKKAVAPSSSYAAKRLSLSSLTVAAHPGLVGGAERLYQKINGRLAPEGNFQASLGFTAPIGLEFTWGCRVSLPANTTDGDWEQHRFVGRKGKRNDKVVRRLSGEYFGLMLQVVDIGAVVNYRLNDPEKELPDEITFKQIFSPGVLLHYGFRNIPLTLGAGVQYTPALRELNSTSTTVDLNAVRLLARLTWDLPLVNIFTKTEKRRP